MFRKLQISNCLPNRYFPKIVVGCPCLNVKARGWLKSSLVCFQTIQDGRIDFGSIIILSACGMNETFFFSIKFTQQIQKDVLDFSYVERTDFFVERTDYFMERSDRLASCTQQTTDEQIKIFVTENTESDTFCMKEYSEKYTIVV